MDAEPASLHTAAPANPGAGLRLALNPAIYLISILPAAGVVLLAQQEIWWAGLASATIAVVLLQHAINLFNDVSDWRLGADTHKHDSWVRAHRGNTRIVTLHGIASAVLGIAIGVATLLLADKLWILLIALPMAILGYLYNAGERPLSYTVLGEWVTGLCYGPGVFGCLYLLAHNGIDAAALPGMITFAALAMALLLSHQPPQIETDRAAGKHSFAVRYGAEKTRLTARLLFVFGLSSFALAAWLAGQLPQLLAFLLLGGIAVLLTCRRTPNPKLLLLSASSVFFLALGVPLLLNLSLAG